MRTILMTVLWLRWNLNHSSCLIISVKRWVQCPLLTLPALSGSIEYRGSSISRKEDGCSKEWKTIYTSFSCMMSFSYNWQFFIQLNSSIYFINPLPGACWEGEGGCFRYASLFATWICIRPFRDAVCYMFSRSNMSGKLMLLKIIFRLWIWYILLDFVKGLAIITHTCTHPCVFIYTFTWLRDGDIFQLSLNNSLSRLLISSRHLKLVWLDAIVCYVVTINWMWYLSCF